MNTVLFIISLITSLVMAGSSFAANHHYAGIPERQPPAPASDIFIVSDEYAVRQNLEVLLQKLNDPDPFVRVEAVQALGEIQKEKSLATLCDCLTDENLYVRAYAAEALGKIGQVDIALTLSRLLPALDDPSPYVRAMMLVALGELQDKRAIDSIRELLQDEDASVREMAAWALGNIEKSQ
jgi:HEAT repeat protein